MTTLHANDGASLDVAFESHTTRWPELARSERALLLAVLDCAVNDLRKTPHRLRLCANAAGKPGQQNYSLRYTISVGRSVVEWFSDEQGHAPYVSPGKFGGFSFVFICETLNMLVGRTAYAPRRIRKALDGDITRANVALAIYSRRDEARALIVPIYRGDA